MPYDHRGSGASDHPTQQSDYSLENLAGEFGVVIDATAHLVRNYVVGDHWNFDTAPIEAGMEQAIADTELTR
ncbi:hypothetical protein ACQPW1_11200 [Nocardia sp. CA-128927]|uniref:hypothetical protein n=1 Tax=Nocardia sp. CA-128927 TaxID=3239975 RepID=UPI003D97FDAC